MKIGSTGSPKLTAVPIRMTSDALETPADGEATMPDFRGMSMRRVLQVMEKRNINIRLMGSGRAMEQSPPPGQKIRGIDEVWIKFAPSA